MKKGKRSAGWQEEEQTSSGRIEFDFSDDDSDDDTETVIDLEDILEEDDASLLEDEEQLDLDVEILDADADLSADELDVGLNGEDDDLLEEDFLKEFSAAREEPKPEEDEGEELLEGTASEEDVDLDSFLKLDEDEDGLEIEEVPLQGALESVPAAALPEEDTGAVGPSSLEPFVAQIEEHLIDAVRRIVEEKLPDIVRSLLDEQIEKLKRELH